jgi:hypothetical protein
MHFGASFEVKWLELGEYTPFLSSTIDCNDTYIIGKLHILYERALRFF